VSRSAGALRVPILLDDIIPKLGARPAEIRPVVPKRHASVAMILEAGADEPTVLLLERARRHNDPWSGQIALPGGRRDPCDRDEQAVAVRETREEIGVELSAAHCVGRLDDLEGRRGGTSEGMVISCFVYAFEEAVATTLNHEVAAVARLPLSHFVDAGNHVHVDWREETSRRFPGVRLGARDPRVVWGLTYRFLHQFFDRLGHRLPEGG